MSTNVAFVPPVMKVLLTRKFAERIDGVDLVGRRPGDLLDLPPQDAWLLVAERWAIPERRQRQSRTLMRRRVTDTTDLPKPDHFSASR